MVEEQACFKKMKKWKKQEREEEIPEKTREEEKRRYFQEENKREEDNRETKKMDTERKWEERNVCHGWHRLWLRDGRVSYCPLVWRSLFLPILYIRLRKPNCPFTELLFIRLLKWNYFVLRNTFSKIILPETEFLVLIGKYYSKGSYVISCGWCNERYHNSDDCKHECFSGKLLFELRGACSERTTSDSEHVESWGNFPNSREFYAISKNNNWHRFSWRGWKIYITDSLVNVCTSRAMSSIFHSRTSGAWAPAFQELGFVRSPASSLTKRLELCFGSCE